MNRVGIVYHPLNKDACSLAKKLAGFLCSSGVESWMSSAWEGDEVRENINGSDLILTIGGDGTILRAAQAVAPHSVPITGINLGRLGFLTELTADEAIEKLPALLAGKGWAESVRYWANSLSEKPVWRQGSHPWTTFREEELQ